MCSWKPEVSLVVFQLSTFCLITHHTNETQPRKLLVSMNKIVFFIKFSFWLITKIYLIAFYNFNSLLPNPRLNLQIVLMANGNAWHWNKFSGITYNVVVIGLMFTALRIILSYYIKWFGKSVSLFKEIKYIRGSLQFMSL